MTTLTLEELSRPERRKLEAHIDWLKASDPLWQCWGGSHKERDQKTVMRARPKLLPMLAADR